MKFLFAHISWMPKYSGRMSEHIFSTHGYVVENKKAGERSNFKEIDGLFYGYVPVPRINIDRLGAEEGADHIDKITVIWFANNPLKPNEAFIVGWYRNARVFRDTQLRGEYGYRISCNATDATLLAESVRDFRIPHVRSLEGRTLGYGYGQSSIWYAEGVPPEFLDKVAKYIHSVDALGSGTRGLVVDELEDAIDDLDQASLGNETPSRKKFSSTFIVRDNRVRAQVVKRANGKCEFCHALGFKKPNGTHFVEAHHIISLAEQGPDTLDNVIALCPNHHREAHFGLEWEQLETKFKAKLAELRGK
jgi:hypothetical protein